MYCGWWSEKCLMAFGIKLWQYGEWIDSKNDRGMKIIEKRKWV